jgi:hypothetical protein
VYIPNTIDGSPCKLIREFPVGFLFLFLDPLQISMSDPSNCTVKWICALRVEYVAAQEFLDEEHDPQVLYPSRIPTTMHQAELGSIMLLSPSCLMVNMGQLPPQTYQQTF